MHEIRGLRAVGRADRGQDVAARHHGAVRRDEVEALREHVADPGERLAAGVDLPPVPPLEEAVELEDLVFAAGMQSFGEGSARRSWRLHLTRIAGGPPVAAGATPAQGRRRGPVTAAHQKTPGRCRQRPGCASQGSRSAERGPRSSGGLGSAGGPRSRWLRAAAAASGCRARSRNGAYQRSRIRFSRQAGSRSPRATASLRTSSVPARLGQVGVLERERPLRRPAFRGPAAPRRSAAAAPAPPASTSETKEPARGSWIS